MSFLPPSNTTTTSPPERLLLTPREAAAALTISERTLWSMAQSGEIPSVRIGRSVRYSVAALEAWIASKSTFMAEQGQQAAGDAQPNASEPCTSF